MDRRLLATVVAVVAATITWAAAAAAAPPGTYKGSLYLPSGAKIARAPVTVTVAGTKLTIKAPRLPIKCQDAAGRFTQPADPIAYEYKGTLRGNVLTVGEYIPPLGGAGEYFLASVVFQPEAQTVTGKIAFVGAKCKGAAKISATKA